MTGKERRLVFYGGERNDIMKKTECRLQTITKEGCVVNQRRTSLCEKIGSMGELIERMDKENLEQINKTLFNSNA
jgi:hypothetical protein